jgi:Tat protein secretion system quality control protein TatD with DNase activity
VKWYNKLIIVFEIIVLVFFANIIGSDWNKNPVTKDYFSLVIIGEIGLDLYIRLKNKTNV